MPNFRLIFLYILCCHSIVSAQTVASEIGETLPLGVNPMDFISRFEISNEYEHLDERDASNNTTTIRADYAPNEYFLVRLDLPFVYSERESSAEFGLGDIQLRPIFRLYQNNKTAVMIGTDVFLDTGDEEKQTGLGRNRIGPLLAVSFELFEDLEVVPFVQYVKSFGGSDEQHIDEHSEEHSNELEELIFRLLFLYEAEHDAWVLLDPELVINLEENGDTIFVTKLEFGKMVFDSIGAFFETSTQLGGNQHELDWGIKIGARYLFYTT